MRIGIQALGVIGLDPGQEISPGFEAVAEAGFECVDFSLEAFYDTRSVSDTSIPCFYDKSPDELKSFFEPYLKACAKCGLTFSQMHGPFMRYIADEYGRAHFLEIEKKAIEIAGFMGSSYIVLHPVIADSEADVVRELQINRDFFSIYDISLRFIHHYIHIF